MINKITKIITKGVEKGDFPGANFCFINNNKIDCQYIGYKQIYPNKVKLVGDEIYDIASLSKIISTTTIIFKLIEKKLIKLQRKVKDILPDYIYDQTTIGDLLLHRSGLPAMIKDAYKIKSKEELIRKIYEEKLVYKPRTKIVYSDVGYILLGFIIENVTSENIDKIANELIFKPLNMKNTTYKPIKEKSVPTEYRDDFLYRGLLRGIVHDERSFLLNGLSGHAGLFSSAYDIANYIHSFIYDNKLFNDKTKQLILKTNISLYDLENNLHVRTYGFNKFSNKPETNNFLIHHTGFTGCNLWIDFKNKRGFVLLTNSIHPKREYNKIFSYRQEIIKLFY